MVVNDQTGHDARRSRGARGAGRRGGRWAGYAVTTVLAAVVTLLPAGGPAFADDPPGTVRGWGDNSSGQLGDGTTVNRLTPTSLPRPDGRPIDSMAAGAAHTLAVDDLFRVWAWGNNDAGALGDGTRTRRASPVLVAGLGNVFSVAAGAAHSLALDRDGAVWAWGSNGNGQLGDGTTQLRTRPVRVQGLPGPALQISAGDFHSLAVLNDGSLWAWGLNNHGQLGDGTITGRSLPVRVPLPDTASRALRVDGGSAHTVAILGDVGAWTWGDNRRGQLGDGTTVERRRPVRVPVPGRSVIDVSAGTSHTLALVEGRPNVAFAWGDNTFGQLGDGTTTPRTAPVRVGLVNPTDLEAGAFHNLAIEALSVTALRTWGLNDTGQLGDGTTVNRNVPVPVNLPVRVCRMAAGARHSFCPAFL
ncbi:hypothetical protein MF672_031780 [Actinomadura sp. ATCC 31491]|uniref:Chromosome condensation regulator RCC1 n=1 Tax=Actinomadura luzonensis TaxID=2805427 RepID=A0ABT0G1D4_9ACTN|nr:hypothetical protein [Actinomadura luzonensis]MCK2218339.1 hypothetical protein [Actinomadura luzonensis]